MNKTLTVDEAREALITAERNYLEIEKQIKEDHVGLSTPERVLANIELKADYEQAAQALVEAKAQFEKVEQETNDRLRTEAESKLKDVESQLASAVGEAEAAMDGLFEQLAEVVNLSKQRYAHAKTARGRASQSMLARRQISGWLRHRLSDLELADLGRAERHHRDRLANLLGLDHPDFEDTTHPKEDT